jgi:hypothetical protein
MREELLALIERFVRLGNLLPEDLDESDVTGRAEAKLILAEMNKTKAKIDALVADQALRTLGPRRTAGPASG